jgi:hypothetical protein
MIARGIGLCSALALLALASLGASQPPSLTLTLRRTFGYALGDDIQGSFSLTLQSPGELQRARFFVDDGLLAAIDGPPFRTQLHTGDFPTGAHRLWAEGEFDDGVTATSNVIDVNFVSGGAGERTLVSILMPILVVIGAALGVSALVVALATRRFRPGVYGRSGGAVCPRCGLPMSRHWFALKVGPGKWERCPHCGKWSVVRRAAPEDLLQAEARWRGEEPQATPDDDATRRRQIDDSRYME